MNFSQHGCTSVKLILGAASVSRRSIRRLPVPTHQPQLVRILIADNQVLPDHRVQQMVASHFEVVGIMPCDTEQAISQTLWLRPDIVLINIAVRVDDWSQLVKRILEGLPRTRVLLYQND